MSTRKFAESHEWIEIGADGVGTVGISNFAQSALGDIVFVELPASGRSVNAKEPVAVVESVKSVSDIYSPVSGTIVEVNESLTGAPETINAAAETDAWLFKIKLSNPDELKALLDPDAYASQQH
ncbi:MAG: glycine cleavage system protein GcvH [Pseudomonadales bacterium]|jgi:glycine cleavage system H protein|nr:glycine cleavage system protein GcvH [Pseudomonadales bacterium]